MSASRFLGLFGTDARWANVKDGVKVFKFGNAFDVLVRIEKIVVRGVTQSLVPKQALRFFANGIHWRGLLDEFVEREMMVHSRQLCIYVV